MPKTIDTKPQIRTVTLSRYADAPYNPREISEPALDGLGKSLQEYGYVDLIVVNKRTQRIIAGHQRRKALIAQGVKTAPVIIVDVDEPTERAMCLSLNNKAIAGEWTAALAPLLEQLRSEMPDDDFLALRLDQLRQEAAQLEADAGVTGLTMPDDIPPTPPKAITRLGDLWQLGDHRLLCGDSTNQATVARLMGDERAALFATDPPYLVNYTGKDRPPKKVGGKSGGKDWSQTYREIDIKDAESFVRDFLSAGLELIQDNAAIYLWHAQTRYPLLKSVADELGILVHQQIIWVKPTAVMGFSFYSWQHEPCLLAWQKGHKPDVHKEHKKVGTVWVVGLARSGDPESPEYYSDIWHLDWQGKKRPPNVGHPTVKPVEIFAIPMRVHTQPGDICYEPFCGSGSQIIAAETTRRRCYAIELQPVFCDVAVTRWENFTGRKAKLIETSAKKTTKKTSTATDGTGRRPARQKAKAP